MKLFTNHDWSLLMIYQSTDTQLTLQENVSLCIVQHGAQCLTFMRLLFQTEQVNTSKND